VGGFIPELRVCRKKKAGFVPVFIGPGPRVVKHDAPAGGPEPFARLSFDRAPDSGQSIVCFLSRNFPRIKAQQRD
jgi:hypothetical protein